MARRGTIFLLMSGVGKVQTDKDTALDVADLDTRINVTSPNWVETAKTIEEIFDCVQQDITGKEVTRILRRLPIEGEFTARIMAVLAAYGWGVAAAPTGATTNETQTVTIADATGGTFKFTLVYDGITAFVNVPWDATAAQFKHAIESLDNIGYGNTTVGFAGVAGDGVYTIEYVGKRAAANIPTPTADVTNLDGVGAAVGVASTITGEQKIHNITELPNDEFQPPYTTFGIGFEDEEEDGSGNLVVGAVIDNLRFTGAASNGKVTFAGDIIARDLTPQPDLEPPTCVVYRPTRLGDCILTRNSVDLTDILKDFELSFSNNTLTGDTAYTGRGVKPSRLERANKRTRSLTYGLLGGVLEAVYQEAEINPEANILRATTLRIGPEGDSLTVSIPNGLTELNTGGGLSFDGESEEAVNRLIDTPTKQSTTLPTAIVARVPITAQLLD